MFTWLKRLWKRVPREAEQRAWAFVDLKGERDALGISLRADESDRWVFAVFYREGPRPCKPARYKLVEVRKESSDVAEVSPAEFDRYRLRNYK